jgi:hypothetical protein
MASLAEPGPTMIGRLAAALDQIGLPAWFIAIDLLWLAKLDVLAIDARHYQRATNDWLAGSDPYAVMEGTTPYFSGPHTLLFYAPTSLLPVPVATWIWMALGLAASIWLIRRLELPLWWVLFPPLAHAIWNGNPQTIAVALLVLGGPRAAAAAVGLKLYTGLALAFRWREAVAAGIVLLVTLPLVPWQLYLEHSGFISEHLATAWNGSAWRFPILLPIAALAIWILRREGGGWHAVGALWPATQFYYNSMALPAIAHRKVVTACLAVPMPLMAPLVVITLAVKHVIDARRRAHGSVPRTSSSVVEASG